MINSLPKSIWIVTIESKLFEPVYDISSEIKPFYKKEKALEYFNTAISEAMQHNIFSDSCGELEDEFFNVSDETNSISISLSVFQIE